MSETRDAKSYLDYLRIRADEMTEAEIKGDYKEMIDVIRRELSRNWNSIEDGIQPTEIGEYNVVYVDKTDLTRTLHYATFMWVPIMGWNIVVPEGMNKEFIKLIAWRNIPFYCE